MSDANLMHWQKYGRFADGYFVDFKLFFQEDDESLALLRPKGPRFAESGM